MFKELLNQVAGGCPRSRFSGVPNEGYSSLGSLRPGIPRRSNHAITLKRSGIAPVIAHETTTARSLEQRHFTDAPAPAASGQVPGGQYELPGAVAEVLR